ncbi:glucose-6-phosphate dehydrogenase [Patescibacteria group bacterium]|nr:glucose-6-phosphate dehydrogenase [Patescibacteria group bacterium]
MTDNPKIPTIVVVLGATGDLTAQKITPALWNLYRSGSLPRMFRVVGFARRPFPDRDFAQMAAANLLKRLRPTEAEEAERFLGLFSYSQGFFERRADYLRLKKRLDEIDEGWGMCSNKLFYLAVPPRLYPDILNHLASTGLGRPCGGPDEGWTRIIVEKPFGSDLQSAKDLDVLLGELFAEDQIYRIDHYLAKEMLQNILAFRFSNDLFEPGWNRSGISEIRIRLWESLGVEGRGGFYDGVGALRDVGQNHLLQMLALTAMARPRSFSSRDVRAARQAFIESLVPFKPKEIRTGTIRGQYDGYRGIKGVASDSATETYFRVEARSSDPPWKGVKFVLESGKRLGRSLKEIEIVSRGGADRRNSLVFHVEPKEGITIKFWAKKPGRGMELQERKLGFKFRPASKAHPAEDYEKLLWDCLTDDQTLFVSSGEIQAMWRFIDPIIDGWQKGLAPLLRYKPDSSSITKAGGAAK